jgi:hypothetical protein
MSNLTAKSHFLLATTLVITVLGTCYYLVTMSLLQPEIWRFNFAPSSATPFRSFITIHGMSDYHSRRGFGWLDASGGLVRGSWRGKGSKSWESRDNVTLISRNSPDDLAQTHASGPATFALDVAPGHYEVWVLSGDAGYREYAPWQNYRIVAEGHTVYNHHVTAEQYYQQLTSPPRHDDLTAAAIWSRYVEPRFAWHRIVVAVNDGQLNIELQGKLRDRSKASLAGDYPHTEDKYGPEKAYSGALNALVVVALKHDSKGASAHGARTITKIDQWRMRNFNEKTGLKNTSHKQQTNLQSAGKLPDYVVATQPLSSLILPDTPLLEAAQPTFVRATPGETAVFNIAIQPFTDLGNTRIQFSHLHGPTGANAGDIALGDHLRIGVVRYRMGNVGGKPPKWFALPGMIVPVDNWDINKGVNKQFWITYRIPEKMAPGQYQGRITITPSNAPPRQLDVTLEVLPFSLHRPNHLTLGMTYFSPVQDAWFDEERYWQRMATEFADMRAQGFTTVQYTGVGINDHARMDRVARLYRDAGFEQPLVLLECYGAMDRLRREGIAWESEDFQQRYRAQIERLLATAKTRKWPPLIINFGDEFTNTGNEEFGVKVARSLKKIPGIVTSADANGYKEVHLLAPEVNILAFNGGWQGPDRTNSSQSLVTLNTVNMVRNAGAQPWLVNIGKDRFSNGFWLWKMSNRGVRGKLEWIYRGYQGMPYNPVDGNAPMRSQLVYPGPNNTMVHTLRYEMMRLGFDDLAYLYTLEQLIEARHADANSYALSAAKRFLHNLDTDIDVNLNFLRFDDDARWSAAKYTTMRAETIAHILNLIADVSQAADSRQ